MPALNDKFNTPLIPNNLTTRSAFALHLFLNGFVSDSADLLNSLANNVNGILNLISEGEMAVWLATHQFSDLAPATLNALADLTKGAGDQVSPPVGTALGAVTRSEFNSWLINSTRFCQLSAAAINALTDISDPLQAADLTPAMWVNWVTQPGHQLGALTPAAFAQLGAAALNDIAGSRPDAFGIVSESQFNAWLANPANLFSALSPAVVGALASPRVGGRPGLGVPLNAANLTPALWMSWLAVPDHGLGGLPEAAFAQLDPAILNGVAATDPAQLGAVTRNQFLAFLQPLGARFSDLSPAVINGLTNASLPLRASRVTTNAWISWLGQPGRSLAQLSDAAFAQFTAATLNGLGVSGPAALGAVTQSQFDAWLGGTTNQFAALSAPLINALTGAGHPLRAGGLTTVIWVAWLDQPGHALAALSADAFADLGAEVLNQEAGSYSGRLATVSQSQFNAWLGNTANQFSTLSALVIDALAIPRGDGHPLQAANLTPASWTAWLGQTGHELAKLSAGAFTELGATILNGLAAAAPASLGTVTQSQFGAWLQNAANQFSALSLAAINDLTDASHPLQSSKLTPAMVTAWLGQPGHAPGQLSDGAFAQLGAAILNGLAVSGPAALGTVTRSQFNAWLGNTTNQFSALSAAVINALTDAGQPLRAANLAPAMWVGWLSQPRHALADLSAAVFSQAGAAILNSLATASKGPSLLASITRSQFNLWLGGSGSFFQELTPAALNALTGASQPLQAANLTPAMWSGWLTQSGNSLGALSATAFGQIGGSILNELAGPEPALLGTVTRSQFDAWLANPANRFSGLAAATVNALTDSGNPLQAPRLTAALWVNWCSQAGTNLGLLSAAAFARLDAATLNGISSYILPGGVHLKALYSVTQSQFNAWLASPGNAFASLTAATLNDLYNPSLPLQAANLTTAMWVNWATQSGHQLGALAPAAFAQIDATNLNGLAQLSQSVMVTVTQSQFNAWLARPTNVFASLDLQVINGLGNSSKPLQASNLTQAMWSSWFEQNGSSLGQLSGAAFGQVSAGSLNDLAAGNPALLGAVAQSQFNAWLVNAANPFSALSVAVINGLSNPSNPLQASNLTSAMWSSWFGQGGHALGQLSTAAFAQVSADALNGLAAGNPALLGAVTQSQFNAWLGNSNNQFASLSLAVVSALTNASQPLQAANLTPALWLGWAAVAPHNMGTLSPAMFANFGAASLNGMAGGDPALLGAVTQSQFHAWLADPGNQFSALSAAAINALNGAGQPLRAANLTPAMWLGWAAVASHSLGALSPAVFALSGAALLNGLAGSNPALLGAVTQSQFNAWLANPANSFQSLSAAAISALDGAGQPLRAGNLAPAMWAAWAGLAGHSLGQLSPTAFAQIGANALNFLAAGTPARLGAVTQSQFNAWLAVAGNQLAGLPAATLNALTDPSRPLQASALSPAFWANWAAQSGHDLSQLSAAVLAQIPAAAMNLLADNYSSQLRALPLTAVNAWIAAQLPSGMTVTQMASGLPPSLAVLSLPVIDAFCAVWIAAMGAAYSPDPAGSQPASKDGGATAALSDIYPISNLAAEVEIPETAPLLERATISFVGSFSQNEAAASAVLDRLINLLPQLGSASRALFKAISLGLAGVPIGGAGAAGGSTAGAALTILITTVTIYNFLRFIDQQMGEADPGDQWAPAPPAPSGSPGQAVIGDWTRAQFAMHLQANMFANDTAAFINQLAAAGSHGVLNLVDAAKFAGWLATHSLADLTVQTLNALSNVTVGAGDRDNPPVGSALAGLRAGDFQLWMAGHGGDFAALSAASLAQIVAAPQGNAPFATVTAANFSAWLAAAGHDFAGLGLAVINALAGDALSALSAPQWSQWLAAHGQSPVGLSNAAFARIPAAALNGLGASSLGLVTQSQFVAWLGNSANSFASLSASVLNGLTPAVWAAWAGQPGNALGALSPTVFRLLSTDALNAIADAAPAALASVTQSQFAAWLGLGPYRFGGLTVAAVNGLSGADQPLRLPSADSWNQWLGQPGHALGGLTPAVFAGLDGALLNAIVGRYPDGLSGVSQTQFGNWLAVNGAQGFDLLSAAALNGLAASPAAGGNPLQTPQLTNALWASWADQPGNSLARLTPPPFPQANISALSALAAVSPKLLAGIGQVQFGKGFAVLSAQLVNALGLWKPDALSAVTGGQWTAWLLTGGHSLTKLSAAAVDAMAGGAGGAALVGGWSSAQLDLWIAANGEDFANLDATALNLLTGALAGSAALTTSLLADWFAAHRGAAAVALTPGLLNALAGTKAAAALAALTPAQLSATLALPGASLSDLLPATLGALGVGSALEILTPTQVNGWGTDRYQLTDLPVSALAGMTADVIAQITPEEWAAWENGGTDHRLGNLPAGALLGWRVANLNQLAAMSNDAGASLLAGVTAAQFGLWLATTSEDITQLAPATLAALAGGWDSLGAGNALAAVTAAQFDKLAAVPGLLTAAAVNAMLANPRTDITDAQLTAWVAAAAPDPRTFSAALINRLYGQGDLPMPDVSFWAQWLAGAAAGALSPNQAAGLGSQLVARIDIAQLGTLLNTAPDVAGLLSPTQIQAWLDLDGSDEAHRQARLDSLNVAAANQLAFNAGSNGLTPSELNGWVSQWLAQPGNGFAALGPDLLVAAVLGGGASGNPQPVLGALKQMSDQLGGWNRVPALVLNAIQPAVLQQAEAAYGFSWAAWAQPYQSGGQTVTNDPGLLAAAYFDDPGLRAVYGDAPWAPLMTAGQYDPEKFSIWAMLPGNDMSQVPAALFNTLPPAFFDGLGLTALGQISLAQWRAHGIAGLGAQTIDGMSPAVRQALSADELSGWLAQGGQGTLGALAGASVADFAPAVLAALPASALAGLQPQQIQAWTAANPFTALSPAVIAALSPQTLAAVPTADLAAWLELPGHSLAALGSAQFAAAVTGGLLNALPSAQVAAVGADDWAAWTAAGHSFGEMNAASFAAVAGPTAATLADWLSWSDAGQAHSTAQLPAAVVQLVAGLAPAAIDGLPAGALDAAGWNQWLAGQGQAGFAQLSAATVSAALPALAGRADLSQLLIAWAGQPGNSLVQLGGALTAAMGPGSALLADPSITGAVTAWPDLLAPATAAQWSAAQINGLPAAAIAQLTEQDWLAWLQAPGHLVSDLAAPALNAMVAMDWGTAPPAAGGSPLADLLGKTAGQPWAVLLTPAAGPFNQLSGDFLNALWASGLRPPAGADATAQDWVTWGRQTGNSLGMLSPDLFAGFSAASIDAMAGLGLNGFNPLLQTVPGQWAAWIKAQGADFAQLTPAVVAVIDAASLRGVTAAQWSAWAAQQGVTGIGGLTAAVLDAAPTLFAVTGAALDGWKAQPGNDLGDLTAALFNGMAPADFAQLSVEDINALSAAAAAGIDAAHWSAFLAAVGPAGSPALAPTVLTALQAAAPALVPSLLTAWLGNPPQDRVNSLDATVVAANWATIAAAVADPLAALEGWAGQSANSLAYLGGGFVGAANFTAGQWSQLVDAADPAGQSILAAQLTADQWQALDGLLRGSLGAGSAAYAAFYAPAVVNAMDPRALNLLAGGWAGAAMPAFSAADLAQWQPAALAALPPAALTQLFTPAVWALWTSENKLADLPATVLDQWGPTALAAIDTAGWSAWEAAGDHNYNQLSAATLAGIFANPALSPVRMAILSSFTAADWSAVALNGGNGLADLPASVIAGFSVNTVNSLTPAAVNQITLAQWQGFLAAQSEGWSALDIATINWLKPEAFAAISAVDWQTLAARQGLGGLDANMFGQLDGGTLAALSAYSGQFTGGQLFVWMLLHGGAAAAIPGLPAGSPALAAATDPALWASYAGATADMTDQQKAQLLTLISGQVDLPAMTSFVGDFQALWSQLTNADDRADLLILLPLAGSPQAAANLLSSMISLQQKYPALTASMLVHGIPGQTDQDLNDLANQLVAGCGDPQLAARVKGALINFLKQVPPGISRLVLLDQLTAILPPSAGAADKQDRIVPSLDWNMTSSNMTNAYAALDDNGSWASYFSAFASDAWKGSQIYVYPLIDGAVAMLNHQVFQRTTPYAVISGLLLAVGATHLVNKIFSPLGVAFGRRRATANRRLETDRLFGYQFLGEDFLYARYNDFTLSHLLLAVQKFRDNLQGTRVIWSIVGLINSVGYWLADQYLPSGDEAANIQRLIWGGNLANFMTIFTVWIGSAVGENIKDYVLAENQNKGSLFFWLFSLKGFKKTYDKYTFRPPIFAGTYLQWYNIEPPQLNRHISKLGMTVVNGHLQVLKPKYWPSYLIKALPFIGTFVFRVYVGSIWSDFTDYLNRNKTLSSDIKNKYMSSFEFAATSNFLMSLADFSEMVPLKELGGIKITVNFLSSMFYLVGSAGNLAGTTGLALMSIDLNENAGAWTSDMAKLARPIHDGGGAAV